MLKFSYSNYYGSQKFSEIAVTYCQYVWLSEVSQCWNFLTLTLIVRVGMLLFRDSYTLIVKGYSVLKLIHYIWVFGFARMSNSVYYLIFWNIHTAELLLKSVRSWTKIWGFASICMMLLSITPAQLLGLIKNTRKQNTSQRHGLML